MKKLELLLAGVMAFSPALFAQQSTPQSDSQSATPSASQGQSTPSDAQSSKQTSTSTTTTTTKTTTSTLTADQKAELKQLKAKAKDACKADKNSDACKSAEQDLHSKMDEYGVKKSGHHKGTKSDSSTQPPS